MSALPEKPDIEDEDDQEFVDNYLVRLFPNHALPSDEELQKEFFQLKAEGAVANIEITTDPTRITNEALKRGYQARLHSLIERSAIDLLLAGEDAMLVDKYLEAANRHLLLVSKGGDASSRLSRVSRGLASKNSIDRLLFDSLPGAEQDLLASGYYRHTLPTRIIARVLNADWEVWFNVKHYPHSRIHGRFVVLLVASILILAALVAWTEAGSLSHSIAVWYWVPNYLTWLYIALMSYCYWRLRKYFRLERIEALKKKLFD